MINVSSEFRETMKNRRDFKMNATINFVNGETLNLDEKDFTISGNSISDGSSSNSVPLGTAVEKVCNLSIMNDKEQFSDYDFYGAKIILKLKFQLSSTVETILKGTYTVVTPETYGTVIQISSADEMYKADKDYDSTLSYPATAGEILRDACRRCNIPLLTTTFENDDVEIRNKPENVTYRQVIGYCAMLACANARINVNNQLEFLYFNTDFLDQKSYSGGTFDKWENEDKLSGGTFYSYGQSQISGGKFGDRKGIHVLSSFKSLSRDTDDVVITGIQIEKEEENVLFGSEGYILKLNNPFFEGKEEFFANYIGNKIVGISFRKFSGDILSDPTVEFMDFAWIVDKDQKQYKTFITDITFTQFSWTNISNSAESAIRNSSKYNSSATESIVAGRKNTEKQIKDYDLAVQQMNSIMANSLGMFTTNKATENGGIISYQHNKPLLEDSDIIWEKSENGFRVSTDGGKTWKAGITADGNSVVNVLSAVGINFDWARGGTLTLGGSLNGNGILRIVDSSDKEIVRGDRFGLTANGTFISSSGNSKVEIRNGRFGIVYTGTEVGYIGSNSYKGDSAKKGLVFDLEDTGAYMTWAVKETPTADTYTMMLTYAKNAVGGYSSGALHCGAPLDMHGLEIRNAKLTGIVSGNGYNGWTGTIPIITKIESNSDGGITWYSSEIDVYNGIVTNAPRK